MLICIKCGYDQHTIVFRFKYFKFELNTYTSTNLCGFNVKEYREFNRWYECKDDLLDCTCKCCGFRSFSYTLDYKDN